MGGWDNNNNNNSPNQRFLRYVPTTHSLPPPHAPEARRLEGQGAVLRPEFGELQVLLFELIDRLGLVWARFWGGGG